MTHEYPQPEPKSKKYSVMGTGGGKNVSYSAVNSHEYRPGPTRSGVSPQFSPLSDIKPGGKTVTPKQPTVGYHRAD